ncbi:hypothetical protein EDD21DRAFT_64260 [Dissophora ornata]|nr:hypothetical protein EDD21DRAFT_64260 [Dissophora ornata]
MALTPPRTRTSTTSSHRQISLTSQRPSTRIAATCSNSSVALRSYRTRCSTCVGSTAHLSPTQSSTSFSAHSPSSTRSSFRWKNFHLCILFLVSAILSTDVALLGHSLVGAEPLSDSARAPLVRRSRLYVPPEGATLYKLEDLPSHKQSPSSSSTSPQEQLVNVMSKVHSSRDKNSTNSTTTITNIISVPLQDLLADTVVRSLPTSMLRLPLSVHCIQLLMQERKF